MTAKSATLLKKLEKALSAKFDAAVKNYYEWKTNNETDAEIFADLRLGLSQTDDPDFRAAVVEGLTARGEPLEVQPGDEKLLLAQWERVPDSLKETLRRVGIEWKD